MPCSFVGGGGWSRSGASAASSSASSRSVTIPSGCIGRSSTNLLMRSGGLPFWSDRFGVGVPLVAESHAAAFYPPNWLFYCGLDPPVAYRLAMWLHYTAIAGLTYLYGRTVGLRPWWGAVAVSFSLCGFQAGHAVHEPIYHALPYLLLSLVISERYLARGSAARLGDPGAVLGTVLDGRALPDPVLDGRAGPADSDLALGREAPWRRVVVLAAAVGWAAAVAAIQLALTWELVQVVGFSRSISDLFLYFFPARALGSTRLPGDLPPSPGSGTIGLLDLASLLRQRGVPACGDRALDSCRRRALRPQGSIDDALVLARRGIRVSPWRPYRSAGGRATRSSSGSSGSNCSAVRRGIPC